MEGDQREIRETEGEQADSDHIERKGFTEAKLGRFRLLLLEGLRVRVLPPGEQDEADGDEGRYPQHGETKAIGGKQISLLPNGGDEKEETPERQSPCPYRPRRRRS